MSAIPQKRTFAGTARMHRVVLSALLWMGYEPDAPFFVGLSGLRHGTFFFITALALRACQTTETRRAARYLNQFALAFSRCGAARLKEARISGNCGDESQVAGQTVVQGHSDPLQRNERRP
jgi:hypothetical protein